MWVEVQFINQLVEFIVELSLVQISNIVNCSSACCATKYVLALYYIVALRLCVVMTTTSKMGSCVNICIGGCIMMLLFCIHTDLLVGAHTFSTAVLIR